MQKRTLVTVFALFSCVGAGGVLLHDREATVTIAPPPRATPVLQTTAAPRDLTPGRERSYAIALDEDVILGRPKAAQGDGRPAKLSIMLRGRFATTFVAHDAGKLRLRCNLHAEEIRLKPQAAETESLSKELALPFYATIEPDGHLAGLHVARSTSSFARGLIRTIAAEMQVTTAEGASWTASELDATGRYRASYTRKNDGTIVRLRTEYTEVGGEHGLEAVSSVGRIEPKGASEIALGPHGFIDRVDARITTHVDAGESLPKITSTTRFSARAEGARQDLAALGAFERDADDLEEISIAGGAPDPNAARRADEKLVNGASLASLASDLERLAGSGPSALTASERLEARLRLAPSDADAIAQRALRAPTAQGQALVTALAGSGTAEGTRATGKLLLDQRASSDLRMHAATSLALATAGRSEAASALTKALSDRDDDVRRASTLALGAVAQGLRSEGPEEAAGAIGELIRSFRAATDDDERAIALRALGNTGDGAVLPIARELLASGSPSLRVVAIHAIRFVASPEADALAAHVLAHGDDPRLRAAAVDTIGHRVIAVHDAVLARALAADADESVRVEIVQLAARSGTGAPELIAAVRAAAEHDSSEEVRRVAASVAARG